MSGVTALPTAIVTRAASVAERKGTRMLRDRLKPFESLSYKGSTLLILYPFLGSRAVTVTRRVHFKLKLTDGL
ncbi:hypothetical protein M404DRAFT_807262 [Pisolithus tinctorius Marx 270]|uniref:Uncharacterized protein n=1 Tax=Pisolithus tinctorius Marx 270 TaxID=870435 RepID=A0A0C3NW37_PISTI|nr:hypothetical protein M404DRAFT_807262 [Pisolithus tinctorius Marx 270]